MHLHSLRTILLCICLLGLASLSSVLGVRAASSALHARHIFRPSGHGTVIPQMVDTATMPHVLSMSTAGLNQPEFTVGRSTQAAPSRSLPAPPNVTNVPPPTSTDPTARKGLFKSGGKPDANGTGGLDNYLETVNGQVGIYTRGGTQQSSTTFQTWFGVNATFYDPVTQWDDAGSRFIFSVLQASAKTIWLSVAQQADATGKFCNYSFPTLAVHDFDKLGVDSDGIYFSFNVLAPGTNNVVNNELFFASRTALESCQTATFTSWTNLTNPDGSLAEAITPARQDSSVSGVEYLVNSYPAGACQLTLWTLTSSGILTNTSVPTQCYSLPPNAKQKGSSALIAVDDCSITQASYVNGLLTVDTLGSYDWGDGNGPVGIVEWYVLNASSASVSSQGAFGTPGYWLFYPSAITTANGHMLFVYNASGASIDPSAWFVNQTFTGAKSLANGFGYYGTSGVNPWGDYQSAWPDASGGTANTVWITGEATRANNVWGTKFDLIVP